MHSKKERVFIKLLLPLAAGLFAAYIFDIKISAWFVLFFLLLQSIVYIFIQKKYLYIIRYSWVYGLSANLFLFFAGFTLFSNAHDMHQANHFRHRPNAELLLVRISEPPVFKEKFVRCIIKTESVSINNNFTDASGNAVAYFSINESSLNFKYGDLVLVKNKPSFLDAPVIPYQYDYKGYLAKRNIYYTLFLKQHEFVPTNENNGFKLLQIAFAFRDWCALCIKKYVNSPDEAAVVSALTVGYRDEISTEIVQSYSSAGVIHILAVSGMHVGLLYFTLEFFLKFLNRNLAARILKMIILLCCIWMFAMITGLGGSIVRASSMISLLIIGRNLKRRMDIIDSLCSSAFLILLITPFTLIDAGFQLSFSALIGIAVWEKYFSNSIEWTNPVLHFIWRMCSVSMAAQLGVLPLTLYYFNQFPTLFLVANVIGVPLSTGILFGGLGLFAVSSFSYAAEFIGLLLKFATFFLNKYILWVQSFSFSTLNIPTFGFISFLLVVIALYYFSNYTESKNPRKIIYCLYAFLLVIMINTFASINYLSRNELLFTHFGKGDLYIFRSKDYALLIADDSLINDNYFHQYTSSFLKLTPVSNIQVLPLSSINDSVTHSWKNFSTVGNFISFENIKGIISKNQINYAVMNMKLDFIIGKTTDTKMQDNQNILISKQWITTAEPNNYNFKLLKNQCAELSLPLHNLSIDGPWIKHF